MWDSLASPWRVVVEETWVAYCAGSIPHGAAITDAAGRIIARGRNRVGEQTGPPGQFFGHKLAHAEMNALLALDWSQQDPTACTLYAAAEPCDHCAGALLVTRIGAVCYGSHDPVGGRADLLMANPSLRPEPITVRSPEHADLALLLMGLRAAYWLRCGAHEARLVAVWREAAPEAISIGEQLRASGALDHLCASDASAATMVGEIAGMGG
jgi:tRNA(adenine34) deaminase